MRTAVFDLDGTLADTGADLIAAANACLIPRGTALDPVTDRATAFRGGRAMLRLGLSRLGPVAEAEVDALYPVLLDAYAGALSVHTRPYPGVEAALDALAAAGWRLAVCTNKPEGLARALLRDLGLLPRFGALIGADTLPVRKPDPEALVQAVLRAGGQMPRAVMIGDTDTDHATARAARVPSILVRFGPEGAGVAALAPDAVLDRFADLPGLMERLLP